MRTVVLPPCLCLLLMLSGCFNSGPNHVYPKTLPASTADHNTAAPAPVALDLKSAVTGFWQGVSSADCLVTGGDDGRCHATQKITLTMIQHGDAVSGFYHCAFGNQVCRNFDEQGVIRDGRMTGRRLQMRVMLGDGSMCFFTGIPAGGVIEGRYSCLQGGGLIERGAFRTVRAY